MDYPNLLFVLIKKIGMNNIYNYLKCKYKFLYYQVNNIGGDCFSEKCYKYIYNLDCKPLCVNCKKNKVRYMSFNKGYRIFCSRKCASNNKSVNDKRIKKRYNNNAK